MTASLEPPCPVQVDVNPRVHDSTPSRMIQAEPVPAASWLSDACSLWARPANDAAGLPAIPHTTDQPC